MLHDLVEEDFPVVDGQVEIPDRPGLGITVREDFLPAVRADSMKIADIKAYPTSFPVPRRRGRGSASARR